MLLSLATFSSYGSILVWPSSEPSLTIEMIISKMKKNRNNKYVISEANVENQENVFQIRDEGTFLPQYQIIVYRFLKIKRF